MSMYDYEQLRDAIYPSSKKRFEEDTREEMSYLDTIAQNEAFMNQVYSALGSITKRTNDGGENLQFDISSLYSLNGNVFKLTRNREDIYFIIANVIDMETGKRTPICFFVNDKMFWFRFKIYASEEKSKIFNMDDNITVDDAIHAAIKNKLPVSLLLNSAFGEVDAINAEAANASSYYFKSGLCNKCPIEIVSSTVFSKYTWGKLLSKAGRYTEFDPDKDTYKYDKDLAARY